MPNSRTALDLGEDSNDCNEDFATGVLGGRVAVGSLALAGGLQATGIQTKIALHGPHHTFGRLGRLPHLQMNWWRAGIKGSGGVVRVPVPPRTPGFPK